MLIKSISTIALVTTMPININRPTIAGTPSGVSVINNPATAPVAANGIEVSRTSGWTRLRKVATMIMNTITMASSIARPS